MTRKKKRYSAQYLRKCIWRSFYTMNATDITIPDLVAGIEDLGYDSAKKALRSLEIHGYVKKHGEKGRGHQRYVKNHTTPLLPAVCEQCGAAFAAKTCDPLFKEKEREKEREREEAERAEQGRARVAEMVERVNDLYDAPRLPEGPVEPRPEIPAELKARLELALNPSPPVRSREERELSGKEVPDDAA